MISDEALESDKQIEETDAGQVEGLDVEETMADPAAGTMAPAAEEITQGGVVGDGGEEGIKLEDAGGTAEVSEAVFHDTPNEDPMLAQQESDAKPDGQEISEMPRAAGDVENEQPRRKRIRRVGMTPVREIPKTEEGPECHDPTANGDIPVPILASAEDQGEVTERDIKDEEIKLEDVKLEDVNPEEPVEALNLEAEGPEAHDGEISGANVVDESKPAADENKAQGADGVVLAPNTPIPGTYADGVYISSSGTRVLSKHDQKWLDMFAKLVEYIKQNGNTAVPQCFHDDPQLGRWVHYQRVEYWIFQQTGSGKITDARINRLNSIGFEWNPQQAQWDKMFTKLKQFKEEIGHCRVPKGYSKDPELANWVRNQRLEQANFEKKKKSRMTPERHKSLNELGFKWSAPTPSRSRKNSKKGDGDEEEGKEDSIKMDENEKEKDGSVLDEAVATAAAAAAAAAVNADAKEDRMDGVTGEGEANDLEAPEGDEAKELEVSSKQDNVKEKIEVPSVDKVKAASIEV